MYAYFTNEETERNLLQDTQPPQGSSLGHAGHFCIVVTGGRQGTVDTQLSMSRAHMAFTLAHEISPLHGYCTSRISVH